MKNCSVQNSKYNITTKNIPSEFSSYLDMYIWQILIIHGNKGTINTMLGHIYRWK